MTKPLEGRNAVVTGASQGLGLAIARAYVDAGASVLMSARDEARLDDARRDVQKRAAANQRVAAKVADVSVRADVDALASFALTTFGRIHVLVNNAGIYGPFGALEDVDWDAWVHTLSTNVLGSVMMARAFLPHFKTHKAGKIIQVSGGGATQPLPRVSAYAASKAAIVRFAESLAGEVRADGIDVNALAPGSLNTQMLDQILAAGPERIGKDLYQRMVAQKAGGGAPPEQAAALAVWMASSASDGITGRLISAVWDPWETLADHRDALNATDVYTLRRIVPADRQLPWRDREK